MSNWTVDQLAAYAKRVMKESPRQREKMQREKICSHCDSPESGKNIQGDKPLHPAGRLASAQDSLARADAKRAGKYGSRVGNPANASIQPVSEIVTPSMGTVKLYDVNRIKRGHGTRYSLPFVLAWFKECGLPEPMSEYRFDPERKWRFDFAWADWDIWRPDTKTHGGLALEVQGGLFSGGAHVRGAALLREHEKLNRAAVLGWRVMFTTPQDLCTKDLADQIRAALAI